MSEHPLKGSYRPPVIARHGVVSSGHYLASMVGYDILRKGGNAFDAGVAGVAALNVLKMDMAGWCGVTPFIGYVAETNNVIYRAGVGTAPKAATPEFYASRGFRHMPQTLLASIMPTTVDTFVAILQDYGTLSLADVLEGAIRVAEEGFPADIQFLKNLTKDRSDVERWPYTAQIFLPGGRVPRLGELIVQKDLAKTMRLLVEGEREALRRGKDRRDALEAAREVFYRGEIAEAVATFYHENGGLVTYEDLATFRGEWRSPMTVRYKSVDLFVTDNVNQGPLLVEYLNLLENVDVAAFQHNSADYIHLLSQVIDLGMSDRWYYYGDPDFVHVPDGLFTKDYGRERFRLIDSNKAFPGMPPKGNPWPYSTRKKAPSPGQGDGVFDPSGSEGPPDRDTTYLCAMDGAGNLFSMTPSDGQFQAPMIPGYGFGLSTRGYRFVLGFPGHPAEIAPGKRPMNTPNPAIALKDGKPLMAFGTPGADQQTQSMLQVFLNIVVFGMTVQEAIDHPRFGSDNFYTSGSPHTYHKGRIRLEGRIDPVVDETLRAKGHSVLRIPDWELCSVCAIVKDERGLMWGGADVRRESYAVGW